MANFLNFQEQTCYFLLLWTRCSFCQTPLKRTYWPISSFSKISELQGRHSILLCSRAGQGDIWTLKQPWLSHIKPGKGKILKPGPCPKSSRLNSLGWSLGKAHLNKFPRCLGRSWAEVPRIESSFHLHNFYPALKAKWTNISGMLAMRSAPCA